MARPDQQRIPAPAQLLGPALAERGFDIVLQSFADTRLARARDMLGVMTGRETPDAVILALFAGRSLPLELAIVAAARARSIPVIGVVHGGGLAERARDERRRLSALLRGCTKVVSPSPWLQRELASIVPDIEVIANPLELSAVPTRARDRFAGRILWMRSLHTVYRPDIAIEAVARARSRHAQGPLASVTLTLAGPDKGELTRCRELVDRLGLADHVSIPGMLTGEEKRQAFVDHDLFLGTNDIDNWPVTLVEAATAGMPTIATRVGGIADLADRLGSVHTVEPGDPETVVEALELLSSDPTSYRALSVAGPPGAEHFAVDQVALEWSDLLDRVLADRVGPS